MLSMVTLQAGYIKYKQAIGVSGTKTTQISIRMTALNNIRLISMQNATNNTKNIKVNKKKNQNLEQHLAHFFEDGIYKIKYC